MSRPPAAPRRSGCRQPEQPRWGRLGVLLCSLLLTVASAAAAAGVLPLTSREPVAAAPPAHGLRTTAWVVSNAGGRSGVGLLDTLRKDPGTDDAHGGTGQPDPGEPPPPARSGSGRRVVFDTSAQRVWLVRAGGLVRASYLVSGSRTDNLPPARYEVYSRSRHATSFDLRSTMQFMVRFAQGQRAAIGFHDIPVDSDGRRLQDPSELGTPRSHGCIRQRRSDARQMWDFATTGTTVVVSA